MKLKTVLNTIAEQVFRDQADADYVTARAAWRMRFREQALWSGLQAAEKYMKAILLFNEQPVLGFRHDLVPLEQAVMALPHVEVITPSWTDEFLKRLSRLGNNRYLTHATNIQSDWLRRLDEWVWCIRRYAQDFRVAVTLPNGQRKGLSSLLLQGVNDPANRAKPHSFRPFGCPGRLEKVLGNDARYPARQALVWNNHFFGARSRPRLRYETWCGSEIPPQHRDWFKSGGWDQQVRRFVDLGKKAP